MEREWRQTNWKGRKLRVRKTDAKQEQTDRREENSRNEKERGWLFACLLWADSGSSNTARFEKMTKVKCQQLHIQVGEHGTILNATSVSLTILTLSHAFMRYMDMDIFT